MSQCTFRILCVKYCKKVEGYKILQYLRIKIQIIVTSIHYIFIKTLFTRELPGSG
jgi:hypothetical protein